MFPLVLERVWQGRHHHQRPKKQAPRPRGLRPPPLHISSCLPICVVSPGRSIQETRGASIPTRSRAGPPGPRTLKNIFMTASDKTERLEARVSVLLKRIIRRAADLQGRTAGFLGILPMPRARLAGRRACARWCWSWSVPRPFRRGRRGRRWLRQFRGRSRSAPSLCL